MKRIYIILILALLFLISLAFDSSIPNNFEVKNILNSTFQWGAFVTVVITLMFILYKKYKTIPLIWISLLLSSLIAWLLKVIVKRPRPFTGITEIILKEGYSFPSGHATVAFAALPFLEESFPRFKWIWLIFIVIIVLLRVYSGIHYLSDVVFGAFLGYSISSLIIWLNKKYNVMKD